MSFFAERKRRNVFRVGIAYVITARLTLQENDVHKQREDAYELLGLNP